MPGTPAPTLAPTAVPPRTGTAGSLGAPMPVPALGPTPRTAAPAGGATVLAEDAVDERDDGPGLARHAFGFLFGLLLTPAAVIPLGLGLARLDAVAGTRAMGTDTLGLGMAAGGVVALVCLALLGAWSPALPVTGGVVWGVGAGAAAAAWPGLTADLLGSLVDDATTPADALVRTATSGDLVVVGVLLLAAGAAAGVARRQARRRAERRRPTGVTGSPAHSRA